MTSPTIKWKKFKKNVREYMEGRWFSEWEEIKNVAETRQNLKIVANARDKRVFNMFALEKGAKTSDLRLELIQGTKNIIASELVDHDVFSLFERTMRLGKLI